MKYIIGCFLLMHSFIPVIGQSQSSQKEAVDTLSEIVVKSFQFNGKWLQVPASVSLINNEQLQIKSTPNLLPSINAIAGVRMEERSPLSYRLSIRGSVIRSPFGVRNIKMYWNDLPISDGGGNTYFNLIDATQIHQIEIIKGAAASMYGAGTTGVVLLQTKINDTAKNAFTAQLNGGSFNQLQQQFSWSYKRKKWAGIVTQSHQQSQGYREHSASRKDN
ncbi:MAG: TonB-dependent receptor plug domain-containing protein, partial [Chitinophagaceae bacterium]